MPDEPADEPAVIRATLTTADGQRLVAEQRVPSAPLATAAIAHPHPQYGGTMHDPVVTTVAQALAAAGIATVRFAFRGTGGSTGAHSGGDLERHDVRAALDHAASLAPGRPLLACGYSFGADVTLMCDHPALAAWFAVAPPLALFDPGAMAPAKGDRPAHLFVAGHDQFAPPPVVDERVASWPSVTVHVLEGADHFFRGSLDRLAAALRSVLASA